MRLHLLAIGLAACSHSALPFADGVDGDLPDLAAPRSDFSEAADLAQPNARFFLEAEEQNQAWGYSCRGKAVGNDGQAFTYDYGFSMQTTDRCPQHEDGLYTEAELRAKFAHRRGALCVVPPADVEGVAEEAWRARSGSLSPPTGRCADSGVVVYSAYRFDDNVGRFRRILLRLRGDVVRDNLAPEAAAATSWFQQSCLATQACGE